MMTCVKALQSHTSGQNVWHKGKTAKRILALVTASLVLSSCQSLFSPSYQSTLKPSDNPQTVEQVQKNDPRAQMGAREHPRIVASYGGEYHDDKTERLV